MRLRRYSICFLLLTAAVLATGAGMAQESSMEKVQASFQAEKSSYVLGEPVWVTYSLMNHGGETLRFAVGNGRKDGFDFSVDSPDGAGFENVFAHMPPGGLTVKELLAPGQTYTRRILLTEYIRFREPGTYTVTCKGNFDIGGEIGSVKGTQNISTIELVMQKDDEALAAIVEQISACLMDENPASRSEAARMLATVRHPCVLEHLQGALQDKDDMVVEYALRGIYNVGNADAKNILAGFAPEGRDSHLEKLARNLLEKMLRPKAGE